MAETICRSLRDGSLEGGAGSGPHRQGLSPKPSRFPRLRSLPLSTLVSHISAGRSPASGLVLVAFHRSPFFYFDFLKSKGLDASLIVKSVRVLDCYSDSLGWKDRLLHSGTAEKSTVKDSVTVCNDVRDAKKLSSILELGKGFTGGRQSSVCCCH